MANGEAIENVAESVYICAKITAAYDDSGKIRRQLNIAKNATISLTQYLEKLPYIPKH